MRYLVDLIGQSIKAHPPVLSIYGRLRERSYFNARVLRPNDHIVIEGYPRSANTFATVAFSLSQPSPTRIANHLHTPGQFVLAKRWSIPALLLIRPPQDAIISYALYLQSIRPVPLPVLIRRYTFFYRSVLPLADHYVLGAFDEITSDFGAVISRVNERYGTSFGLFEHTTENVRRVEEFMEKQRRQRVGRRAKSSLRTALPHPDRMPLRARLRDEIQHRSNRELMQVATGIYQDLLYTR